MIDDAEGGPVHGEARPDTTVNSISGEAGNVVQARDIYGGIHYARPPAAAPIRRPRRRIGSAVAGAIVLIAGIVVFVAVRPSSDRSNPPARAILVTPQPADPNSAGVNGSWVFPRPLPADSANSLTARGPGEVAEWAPQLGGHLAGSGTFLVTITGNAEDGVTITDIGVHVTARRPALTGSLVTVLGQGGTEDTDILFDLDSDHPVAIDDKPSSDHDGKPFFDNGNITLAKNEPITLKIQFVGTRADYLFDLVVTLVVDGTVVHHSATGPGARSFEVTGYRPAATSTIFVPFFESPLAAGQQVTGDPTRFVAVGRQDFCRSSVRFLPCQS